MFDGGERPIVNDARSSLQPRRKRIHHALSAPLRGEREGGAVISFPWGVFAGILASGKGVSLSIIEERGGRREEP